MASTSSFPRTVTFRWDDAAGVGHFYEADGTRLPLNKAGYRTGHMACRALRRFYNSPRGWGDGMEITGMRNPDAPIAPQDEAFTCRMIYHDIAMQAKADAARQDAEAPAMVPQPVQQAQACAAQPSAPIRFDIVDSRTGAVVGTAKTRAGATRSVDRRDNAFGGYRYSVRPIYAALAVAAALVPGQASAAPWAPELVRLESPIENAATLGGLVGLYIVAAAALVVACTALATWCAEGGSVSDFLPSVSWPSLPALPRVSRKRVGGLRFVKVGRLSLSWCIARDARPYR